MTPKHALTVNAKSVSEAWAQAQLVALGKGVKALTPLIVQIDNDGTTAIEIASIRTLLDVELANQRQRLRSNKPYAVQSTSNTIFPESLYREHGDDRQEFYTQYRRLFHRKLKRHNPHGTYFQRMIDYGIDVKTEGIGKNQIEDLICSYTGARTKPVRRASLLQVGILDPCKDLRNQPQRGFPCLQQVAFSPVGDELTVTAFYATQEIFERAYGNFLGLWRLGSFVAAALDLRLARLVCVAAKGKPHGDKTSKGRLQALADLLKIELQTNEQ
jgi:thymidylate synthase